MPASPDPPHARAASGAGAGQVALVFDFGLRHIGVAVALPGPRIARPLATARAEQGRPRWQQLDALVAEWQPTWLVVGEPLNMDGTPSDMVARAKGFGKALEVRYGVSVSYADERLSTFEARGRGADAADTHAIAAEVIAETWLGRQSRL